MTELTREQIEKFRTGLRDECEDDGTRESFDTLCNMAAAWLEVQPRPPGHEPGDITLNADQIKFVTHCEKVAEKRGFAEAIEKAAKEVASIAAIFDSPSIYMGGPTRRAKNLAEEVAAAIRALAPSNDTVRVPREGVYTHRKGGTYDSLGVGHIQTDVPLNDMDEVVIYVARSDGKLYARRAGQFEDGRFTRAMIAEVK